MYRVPPQASSAVSVALTTVSRGVRRLVARTSRFVRTPGAQLLSAVGGMCGGAALIGPWMVGIVLMLGSAAWGADAPTTDGATEHLMLPGGDGPGSIRKLTNVGQVCRAIYHQRHSAPKALRADICITNDRF